MNILFDNIIFSLQKNGGISNYWKTIISRAITDTEINQYFINFENNNYKTLDIDNSRSISKMKHFHINIERFFNVNKHGMKQPFIFHSSYNRICIDKKAKKLKNLIFIRFLMEIKYLVLATAYFPHERVSSAQQGLTSLFGMGRGVALATNHQHKKLDDFLFFLIVVCKFLNRNRNISTSQLNTLLCLHLKPINVIISHGS